MLEKLLYFFLPQGVKDFLNKKSVTTAILALASAASWAAANVSDPRVQKAVPFVVLFLGFLQHVAGKPEPKPDPAEAPTGPIPAPVGPTVMGTKPSDDGSSSNSDVFKPPGA